MTSQHLCRAILVSSLLAAAAGCTAPVPPDPKTAALQHQYQMGCQPQDASGYEQLKQYCGGGGGGGGRN